VFYSPDNDPSTNQAVGPIADLNIPYAMWTSADCSWSEAVDIPSGVSTLAGWSLGRLGPIYFLAGATAAQKAAVHRIILFDPGDSSDFSGCDTHYDINALLGQWLASNSENRLTVFTGLRSEMKSGNRSTFAGLWKQYFAGIWNQPFAWQAQVCDYDAMGHAEILTHFWTFVQNPTDACPSGPNLTAWNP
jgi:hypothetical protein